jgi:hypothetical protein
LEAYLSKFALLNVAEDLSYVPDKRAACYFVEVRSVRVGGPDAATDEERFLTFVRNHVRGAEKKIWLERC